MKLEIYYDQHEELFRTILNEVSSHYSNFMSNHDSYELFKSDDIYNSNYRKAIGEVVSKDFSSYLKKHGFSFKVEIISSMQQQQFWNGVTLNGKAKDLVYFKLRYL